MASEMPRLKALRDRLYNGLKDIEETYVNGSMEHRLDSNLNISFNYVEGILNDGVARYCCLFWFCLYIC